MRERRYALCRSAIAPVLATMAYQRGISLGELDGLILGQESRIAEHFVDVLGLEIGVIGEDLLARLTSGQQAEQPRDRESQMPDAGFAGAHRRIDCNACERHDGRIAGSLGSANTRMSHCPRRWSESNITASGGCRTPRSR